MSLLSGLAHVVAQPVGWASEALGTVQNLAPGTGTSNYTKVGDNITNGGVNGANVYRAVPYSGPSTQGPGILAQPTKASAPTANTDGALSGAYSSGYSSGGGGGSAAAPAVDPAVIDQLNSAIGQLDPQQAVGLQNIANSYNGSANNLDTQKALAQRNYNTSVQQNTQNYANTRNGIQQNISAQANALQRLLGIAGSGNSSAAYEQAPYAAALQGTQQLSGAQQTYGNNASSLDTNWQDTQRQYDQNLNDLNNQRYSQENALKSSIAQTRANLLGQLGTAQNNPGAYTNNINDLLGQITQLGQQYASPVMRTSDINFATPNVANYTLGTSATPGAGATGNNAATSEISPTFLSLLGQQRDQYGNLIQG